MVNDTVGDFIIRLKNAGMVGRDVVHVPHTTHIHAIAEKLQDAGYVAAVAIEDATPQKRLVVTLQYRNGIHSINDVTRISKPGRRLYRKANDLHPVKFGHGEMVLSTPRGILTGTEAKQAHVGGEELFRIW